jgi:hypothetical protein
VWIVLPPFFSFLSFCLSSSSPLPPLRESCNAYTCTTVVGINRNRTLVFTFISQLVLRSLRSECVEECYLPAIIDHASRKTAVSSLNSSTSHNVLQRLPPVSIRIRNLRSLLATAFSPATSILHPCTPRVNDRNVEKSSSPR